MPRKTRGDARRRPSATLAAQPHASALQVFGGVSGLPIDVLMLIFDRIRTRPLLRCVSLVSKRWRAAALSSVTMLGSHKASDGLRRHYIPSDFVRLTTLFPRLTTLTIALRGRIRGITLPASLRSLTLELEEDALDIECFLSPYPPLTHLSLVGEDFYYTSPIFDEFVAAICSSLTHLRLDERDIAGGAKEFVASQRFPLLRSLRVAVGLHGAADLVTRHCSGLTRLALTEPVNSDLFSLCGDSLPKLRFLKVGAKPGPERLESLLTGAPSLTSVSLLSYPHAHRLSSACLSLITKLETPLSAYPSVELPRLRKLTIAPQTEPRESPLDTLPPALLAHLRMACVGRVPPNRLRLARELRDLRLLHLWPFDAPIDFPDLRSLHLACEELRFQEQVASARRFIRSCPKLREITGFDLKNRDLSHSEAIAFERLLQEAAERGVESVTISRASAAVRNVAARVGDAGWLYVGSVPPESVNDPRDWVRHYRLPFIK